MFHCGSQYFIDRNEILRQVYPIQRRWMLITCLRLKNLRNLLQLFDYRFVLVGYQLKNPSFYNLVFQAIIFQYEPSFACQEKTFRNSCIRYVLCDLFKGHMPAYMFQGADVMVNYKQFMHDNRDPTLNKAFNSGDQWMEEKPSKMCRERGRKHCLLFKLLLTIATKTFGTESQLARLTNITKLIRLKNIVDRQCVLEHACYVDSIFNK